MIKATSITTNAPSTSPMVVLSTATNTTQSSTRKLRRTMKNLTSRSTRAEFKRLKTILPSIQRKDNVSRLDIILEAIKYIDDLQDQLIDRLHGPKDEREAALVALTEKDMEKYNNNKVKNNVSRVRRCSDESEDDQDEDTDCWESDYEEEDDDDMELIQDEDHAGEESKSLSSVMNEESEIMDVLQARLL